MLKQLFEKIQLNSGFSLIEAIVSVAILSIAIIPISMVFTTTIGKTIGTRQQLEANEIAQYYMETIKDKDFDDFYDIFPGVGNFERTINFGQDLAYLNFEPVPEGYSVYLKYEVDVDNVGAAGNGGIGVFTLPSANKKSSIDRDADIEFVSDTSEVVSVSYTNNLSLPASETWPVSFPAHTSRTIEITTDRSTPDTYSISYKIGTISYGEINNVIMVDNTFIIDIGDSEVGTPMVTNIVVDSDVPEEVKIFIFEDDENNARPTTEIKGGQVSISRNMYDIDKDLNRIVELRVDVIRVQDNVVVATMTSTKISE